MEKSRLEQQRQRRKAQQKRMKTGAIAAAALVLLGASVWLGQGLIRRNAADTGSAVGASAAPSGAPGKSAAPPTVQATSSPKAGPSASAAGAGAGAATAPVSTASGRATAPPSPGTGPKVSLAFTGDVIFAGNVETILKTNGYDYPYREIAELLQKPDFTIANLETPITIRGEQQQKQYTYRSSPDALPAFKEAGFDVVNLANNHILDYGQDGLLDTLKALDGAKLLHTGAGKNLEEAYRPVIVEKNGIKIAFLGFSHKVPDNSWKAGVNHPGTTQLYDPKQAIKTIQETNEQADLVVVMAHWGEERAEKPLEEHRKMARSFIDAGADLIIGTHPHVLQGLETYQGKWIAYSLGNFLFTTNDHAPSWETAVLQADCSKEGACGITLTPLWNQYAHLKKMEDADAQTLFRRLEKVSYGVGITADGRVQEKAGSGS
ncbi:CapA family protein [Paenibacillus sp. YN15]|uniref:CapA family protein n=1 Tax=Paenibacillus sp. YN15 TaxID=1742774 RepID=UPI000DCB1501|nr:CapA family protein [Paenibacillus sp. YN15]RAU99800.1 CapA family protein [Paenibacillus sp. YN15]